MSVADKSEITSGSNSASIVHESSELATSLVDRHDSIRLLDSLEEILQQLPKSELRRESCTTLNQLVEVCNEYGIGADAINQFGEQFSVRSVSSEADFLSLKPCWNRLTANPMRSFDWHYHWWRTFGSNSELQIFCLESFGEVVGIAPMFADQWLRQSRLRFIGSGKTCTDYPDLIVESKFRAAFINELTCELTENCKFDLIELEGIDDRGPDKELEGSLQTCYWSYQKPTDSCWHFDLPETWEQFYQGRNKSLKRKIRKAEKRVSTGEVTILTTSEGLDFEEAFDHLVTLHQQRFESKGEPGVFADSKFHKFLFEATKELCSNNLAEINVSFADSIPLAAQLYLFADTGPQFYQAGINTDRMDLEPGHLMFTHAVKSAIARNHGEFDFLRGNEPYKPFWGAKPRYLSTVRFVSRKRKPTAINNAYRFARAAKHWGKRKLKSLSNVWNKS
jgi:CelD/BcsL family acetyltransferase involved in cellulose biosynthesis